MTQCTYTFNLCGSFQFHYKSVATPIPLRGVEGEVPKVEVTWVEDIETAIETLSLDSPVNLSLSGRLGQLSETEKTAISLLFESNQPGGKYPNVLYKLLNEQWWYLAKGFKDNNKSLQDLLELNYQVRDASDFESRKKCAEVKMCIAIGGTVIHNACSNPSDYLNQRPHTFGKPTLGNLQFCK
jgi:hypothetical protein